MGRKVSVVAGAWLLAATALVEGAAAGVPADASAASDEDGAALVLLVPGDYNGDGAVTDTDYALFRVAYGVNVEPGTVADGNGDGVVDAADYTVWRDAREGRFAVTVPAPAAGLLAGAGLSLVTRRRRV